MPNLTGFRVSMPNFSYSFQLFFSEFIMLKVSMPNLTGLRVTMTNPGLKQATITSEK